MANKRAVPYTYGICMRACQGLQMPTRAAPLAQVPRWHATKVLHHRHVMPPPPRRLASPPPPLALALAVRRDGEK